MICWAIYPGLRSCSRLRTLRRGKRFAGLSSAGPSALDMVSCEGRQSSPDVREFTAQRKCFPFGSGRGGKNCRLMGRPEVRQTRVVSMPEIFHFRKLFSANCLRRHSQAPAPFGKTDRAAGNAFAEHMGMSDVPSINAGLPPKSGAAVTVAGPDLFFPADRSHRRPPVHRCEPSTRKGGNYGR